MAVYTNPNATSGATLTTGELVGSTIAAIEKTGADAYARDLTLKDAATASNLTVTAAAYLKVSANAVVEGVTLTNGGATPTLRVSNGGTVKNVVTDGTVSLYPYGGKVENVTANTGCYLNVLSNGVVDGGTFNGARLQVGSTTGQPGGTIRNLVIKKTAEGETTNLVRETGSMYDCTISKGAVFRVSGGLAVRTIVSGAGARLYISKGTANSTMVYSGGSGCALGGTVNDTVVFSGGSLFVSGGTVNGTVLSGNSAKLYVSQGTVNDTLVSSGGKMYVYYNETDAATLGTVTLRGKGGESGTADVVFLRAMGGTIDKIVASGGYIHIASGAVVGNLSAYAKEAIKIFLSSGGVVNGGYTSGSFELRLENGGGTVKNLTVGPATYLFWSAGYASGVTIASNAGQFRFYGSSNEALLIEDMTIYGSAKADAATRGLQRGVMSNCRLMSGAFMRQGGGINKNMTVAGTLHLSGGETNDVTVSGYGATIVASGGTISGAVIEDAAVVQINAGAALYDPILRQNQPAQVISGGTRYARINVGVTGVDGGLVSGGVIAGNGNTIEFYLYNNGVASDVTFKRGTWAGAYSGALISGGTFEAGTLVVRGGEVRGIDLTGGTLRFENQGGTAEDNTVRGAGVLQVSKANTVVQNNTILSGGQLTVSGAAVAGTIVSDGGKATVYSGGTLTNTTVSSGGYLSAGAQAYNGKVNGLTVLSGGSLWLTAASASVTGFAAEAGAVISLSLTNAGAATAVAFDTLADCDATIELLNVGTATKTFNIATTGNTNQQFAMVGSSIFEGTFKAGDVYVDPFTQQQLTVADDATTVSVVKYNRTTTNEAATFVSSGATINGGDKELMWDGATVTGAVKLIDTDAAAAITGDAWMDIRACAAETGAAIYGTDLNVNFNGKVQYQLHGTGDTVGNFAGGANYGGSVKGVDMLTYNTTYTGVGYVGGFGTVQNEIEVVFAGGNNLNKDFYMGALYNASKVTGTTSVGNVKATIGEKTDDEISVKGNVYGASAVKAGTITTVENQAALHTVGDVSLTLRAGALTDGKCVFAGGYATGHDTAKLAPVYTVESVTTTISGGNWGTAHGGRGVFGGAFASDSTTGGDDGVYAMVGDVNISITGGTMGNVYGGGWAQKGAKSEVGDVNLTVKGGTIANIFGGGSTSTSGGSTVAGKVTITVSGGTINGDIYARGHNSTDETGAASVIFTGSKNFSCGVYGYSYVGGTDNSATLSFSDYTGTFAGAIGGFTGITFDGAAAATIAPGEGKTISNTDWTFDLVDRADTLAGTSLLTWNSADFAGDKVTVKFTDDTQAAAGWSIAKATFDATTTFDLYVGGSLIAEDIVYDTAVGGETAWSDWKFTNDSGTLKFAKIATA
jgi:autotransporter passenger strand-loop-strand repeat protein